MSAILLQPFIRDVPDFPRAGIVFKDITPLLADADAFRVCIERMARQTSRHDIRGIVAIESRGFILGGALAHHLSLPLLLVRKPGKLPAMTRRVSYDLEYGSGVLEIHADAVEPGRRYAVVDDVLATGGTAGAAANLVEALGGEVGGFSFMIELAGLGGRAKLGSAPVDALMVF